MNRPRVLEDWRADPWDDPGALYEFEGERPRRNSRVLKVLMFTLAALVVLGVLVGGGVGYWGLRQVNPPGDAGEPVNFTVREGESLHRLSERLEAEGIITNARVFRWYAERKGGIELEPGYYTLRPLDTMGNILGRLRTPPEQTYDRVTFPEGFTIEQIGTRLQDRVPRLRASRFERAAAAGDVRSRFQPASVASLEGLLFPDTYQVAGNESERAVLERMVKLMERIATRAGIDEAPEKVGLDPYAVLIVASMIEREAKVAEDRPLIARVIYNRLFFDMPLQIDATLYYQQDARRPFSELRAVDSPYNSYLYRGLPPTPIANPGRASILAALNPAPNPTNEECPDGQGPCAWLYYVLADNEGRHAFATNLADHEANIRTARAAGVLP
jgi:UPF0755 protein